MHILIINDSLQMLPPPPFPNCWCWVRLSWNFCLFVWNNEILYYDAPRIMLFWYIVITAAPVMFIASWFHFNLAQVLKQYLAAVWLKINHIVSLHILHVQQLKKSYSSLD